MKKLLVVFTIAGLVIACNSNKRSSNAGRDYTSVPAAKTNTNSNNVSRVNEPGEVAAPAPKTHLDSMLLHSGAESQPSSYNRNSTYHNGISGEGSGSSYAGYGYAQLRYKKKPKKVKTPVAPVEQELTDNVNIIDSAGTVKKDSAAVNQGW